MEEYLNIGKSLRKVDALALAAGEEKFTDDFMTQSPLYTAFLYSPVAHAEIVKVDTFAAEKVPGVADILYYDNVPGVLHTTAGQGYPEPSPYDTLLFDRKVRFVGDRVALAAAETRAAALEAVKKINVEYKELEPLFDIEKAMDEDAPRIHDGDEYTKIPAEYRPERNLAAGIEIGFGDLEKGFSEADYIEEHVYKMHYASHCAIEPHAAVAYFDERGRLVIISTTQVPFHVRRITGAVLDIPVGMIRVIKPRVGGGFGGKQEVILEPIAALVAWRNKRPARVVFSRREVFVSSRTRHPMRIRLKTGVKEDGAITAIEMDGLMNSGAYGTHALTVLANAGGKVLPLFNKISNLKFSGRTVYTNLPVGGAYRGYGATQGYFAFNQQIDMIARKAGLDITDFIKKWHIKEGETSEVFKALGEGKEGVSQIVRSCKLDECIDAGASAIGWQDKRGKRISSGKDRVKGMGVAVAMQGSGIPEIDMAAASMKLNEDGSFNLFVGATDIGTGSDTILAQIAAEVLTVPAEKIIVLSSDTDLTPFDTGAYASSTTYISGAAVEKCALDIKDQLINTASDMLGVSKDGLILRMGKAVDTKTGRKAPFEKISYHSLYIKNQFQIQAQASHTASESPPPFIAQFAEIDVDKKTGEIHVVQFVSAVDCGMPVNPALVEGQIEGAAVNGLSYALCEEYIFDSKGKMLNPGFWDYKIYTDRDIPEMKTIVVNSFEETGPFGAKSVGEIGINGPAPAVANAVYDAVGVRMYETPMTPEKVWTRMKEAGVI
ncbi:MAG TPA: aldehyde oxidase [Spirochaetes bacterium]|nr:aldehyde oxidase [Spirochaetota bacterium]